MAARRIRNIDRTLDNDIRYRGPLSYRHLLVMGWLGIVFMVVGIWTNLGITMDPHSPQWIYTINRVCNVIGGVALPMLLLANFCIILDEKKTYAQLLKKNAALTLVIVVLYDLLYGRYLYGIVDVFAKDPAQSKLIITELIREGTRTGDLAFNVFIDLFLCTLFMFFLNYVPKRGFFAKHMRVFRFMAVLPVAYEFASLVIRMLSAAEVIRPSFYIYPFLTTKAPMSFVMFVALALYIKVRERIFLKHGKTLREYKEFLKTNANSLQFSIYASLILVVTCVIDLILVIVFITSISHQTINYIYSTEVVDSATLEREISNKLLKSDEKNQKQTEAKDASIESSDESSILEGIFDPTNYLSESEIEGAGWADVTAEDVGKAVDASIFEMVKDVVIADASNVAYAWGFGKHVNLIVLLPFLLLLSYTRVYSNMKIDSIIPKAGIVLGILVSLECLYQGILMFAPTLVKMLS